MSPVEDMGDLRFRAVERIRHFAAKAHGVSIALLARAGVRVAAVDEKRPQRRFSDPAPCTG